MMGSFCKVPHNLRDHLGSVRAVVDASTGAVIERNDYLPFGMRRTTVNTTSGTASGSNASPNRWFFSGKESQSFLSADIPLLDFGARMYDPTTARWTAIDPMAEEYYSVSPYAYCIGNPVSFVDPNGESTWVTRGEGGTFIVTDKGDPFDNDSIIYVTYKDENGVWKKGESIGLTVSPYSFYNFDNNGGRWAIGSVINPKDKTGSDFLQYFYDQWQPELIDYISNARNQRKYDFKVTNGKDIPIYEAKMDPYRGMSIGNDNNGKTIYASVRDIGNIAAGYVAGANGIGWISARAAFDGYQILSNALSSPSVSDALKTGFRRESLSTRIPEYYGWTRGYLNYNSKRRINWYLYDR